MINVTKPFLPPIEDYQKYLEGIWERNWLTNSGPLVTELEKKLQEYLGVKHLLFTNNGTFVLQMALKLLEKNGEVITSPFSYVATTNAILWEGFTPVFVDINETDLCIDASKIEAAITPETVAILATHVYGNPCNIEAIETIAKEHNLKVIYDGAHAFGSKYKGKQILSYGDIATCSFHATKLYHTIEGGCIITDDDATAQKLKLMRSFGHVVDDYFSIGINAKNSEFHAAMGLCNLPHLPEIIAKRKNLCKTYQTLIKELPLQVPVALEGAEYNYAYFPVVFPAEETMHKAIKLLAEKNITSRRYFYPSLNQLPFIKYDYSCPLSESISLRALSLPLYTELKEEEVTIIVATIKQAFY
jgi:dTDP-4-amino-4,6-dideoxygalactose transaminase